MESDRDRMDPRAAALALRLTRGPSALLAVTLTSVLHVACGVSEHLSPRPDAGPAQDVAADSGGSNDAPSDGAQGPGDGASNGAQGPGGGAADGARGPSDGATDGPRGPSDDAETSVAPQTSSAVGCSADSADGVSPLDTVMFGNGASEASHSLTAYFPTPSDTTKVPWQSSTPAPSTSSTTPASDVVAGGLGLAARRLLPRTPNGDVYGGQITFTMAVDPIEQNYLTLKMWGGDAGSGYLILDVNGKEVGSRHGAAGLNEDPLYFLGTGWYAGRFFYRTEPLPLPMTRGKSSVTITIRSLGTIFYYAPIFTYVPQYQQLMGAPSPGLYRAYTHAGAIVDVSGEAQGAAPKAPTPRTVETEANALGAAKSSLNAALANKLSAAPATLAPGDVLFLARCYDAKENQGQSWIAYPSGSTAADLVRQAVAAIDAQVSAESASTAYVGAHGNDSWGGYFGPMGDAIRLLWPALGGAPTMTTVVAYGGTYGTVTRKAGWALGLRASIDYGRFGRQTIANQSMYNATNIYYANRGLLLVDSTKALAESEATRYPKEAWGVLPWMGNDQQTGGTDGMGGGPVPTQGTQPYGPRWFMCTTKGTSKDGDGFPGSDYGEVASFGYRVALDSGDASLAQRTLLMARARCQFRYPSVDDKGFAVMMGTDPIGVRNNDLPSHYAYMGRYTPDDFLMASQGSAAIGDDLLGYFQQGVNDGQAYRNFSNTSDLGSTTVLDPYLPARWGAIKAMAQTNVHLPTTSGEPDFAWVDEENMVVAAKHCEERFYANLYWRQPGFINGLAKVFQLTPTTAHLADAMVDDVRFRPTGGSITTVSTVDAFETPPDAPVAAYGGMHFATAWRSDLASIPPTNRDAGRGTGYTFRYGHWLVGINADHQAPYTVQTPTGFTSAIDLISGSIRGGPVVLAPKTSVVFYLASAARGDVTPSRTLFLGAVGGNGRVVLKWNDAGGAASYNVSRSTTSGTGYETLMTGITTNTVTDTTATAGTKEYYVVTSINGAGSSGYSPEASAIP